MMALFASPASSTRDVKTVRDVGERDLNNRLVKPEIKKYFRTIVLVSIALSCLLCPTWLLLPANNLQDDIFNEAPLIGKLATIQRSFLGICVLIEY